MMGQWHENHPGVLSSPIRIGKDVIPPHAFNGGQGYDNLTTQPVLTTGTKSTTLQAGVGKASAQLPKSPLKSVSQAYREFEPVLEKREQDAIDREILINDQKPVVELKAPPAKAIKRPGKK